ncbi:MAG: DMT family transporter [Rhodovibrionaceae bacterium]
MTPGILLLVLLAAALHATWNALVKSGQDRLVTLALVNLAPAIPAALALPFLPEMDWAAVPYLAASVALHTLYYACLIGAYRTGDLSQVYPIARGSAPVLVAAGAWLLAGEVKTPLEIAGIVVVSLGIVSLAWRPGPLRLPALRKDEAILFALATGLTIAGYSIADGLGGRASGAVFTYIAWLFAVDGIAIVAFTFWRRRKTLRRSFSPHLLRGFAGGAVAATAYSIVIWAMSVAPMAQVVALRETSVLIAAGIGALILKEGFGKQRIAAAAIVVGGAALLHLA